MRGYSAFSLSGSSTRLFAGCNLAVADKGIIQRNVTLRSQSVRPMFSIAPLAIARWLNAKRVAGCTRVSRTGRNQLKLVHCPHSLAASLAALPSMSLIPLKLRRCPHSVVATLATLPSMSLSPFAPFAPFGGVRWQQVGGRRAEDRSQMSGSKLAFFHGN